MVDYASILKVLADHGYEGWLVVEAEQDPKKAPPFHYAQLGCRNLTRLAAVAGFEVKSR
jgi:inosose dehydratase